ncbi:MAG: hypothetical protein C0490_18155 [Marivirga sp.]|nr:hypothetical protein [Marivirga sp.]
MNFKSIIIRLYYMLIYSDGKVNDGEISLGKRMILAEGISEQEFILQLDSLKKRDTAAIYRETLAELKRLRPERQIRCIAWLCVLANSDGFMDKKEWQFIYKIYHKELLLPLDVIMEVQKELVKVTRENSVVNNSVLATSSPSPSSHVSNV